MEFRQIFPKSVKCVLQKRRDFPPVAYDFALKPKSVFDRCYALPRACKEFFTPFAGAKRGFCPFVSYSARMDSTGDFRAAKYTGKKVAITATKVEMPKIKAMLMGPKFKSFIDTTSTRVLFR